MSTILFADALRRAIEGTLSLMELLAATEQLSASSEADFVTELYRVWLQHNAQDPLVYAIHFNHGVALTGAGRSEGAIEAFQSALQINPDYFPAYINLGGLHERMGEKLKALECWHQVVNRLPAIRGEMIHYKLEALKQISRVLESANIDANAEEALRLSLEIQPDQREIIQHWVNVRQIQCKWPVLVPLPQCDHKQLLSSLSPLSFAAYSDDPMLHLAVAFMHSKLDVGQPGQVFLDHHPQPVELSSSARLRVGYLSSDLRAHPVGFLTAEVYELHDRSRVELFLYYTGIPAEDRIHQRAREAAADGWRDISALSDEAAARLMVEDGLHILVDLNGYTMGERPRLVAMRPAPVIVNWLGYPGPMGSPAHHYIIADPFIIPPELELYYTEKVLRLPCYQPNDRHRMAAPQRPIRAQLGLPEEKVIFGCFNGTKKITPFIWGLWMQILHAVPEGVLWLLDGTEENNRQIQQLAQQHGITPERILFAPKLRNPEHLARYPLADLCLDTYPYGSHTTASDALWMGVPLLTLAGRSFASRVCGSLLHAAGMGELVCTDPRRYVELAVELAHHPSRLQALRQRMQSHKEHCTLFDTPNLVAHLERLYLQMWEDYVQGRLPRPDLTNLEVYLDIGMALDEQIGPITAGRNLDPLYQELLAQSARLCWMPDDRRLWNRQPPGSF